MLFDIYTKCFKQVFVLTCILSYLSTFYTLTAIMATKEYITSFRDALYVNNNLY